VNSDFVSSDFDTPYQGGLVGPEHHFAVHIYFEDTDAFGVIYYANYLKFLDRARSDMIRAAGVDQAAELQRSGSAYVVAEVNIRYLASGRLGDDILIVSTIEAVRGVSILIHQRVMRADEQLADARVTAAFLDRNGRPQRQPREWVERFKAIAERT
jgi:acyl-CoA thioester hydrolase